MLQLGADDVNWVDGEMGPATQPLDELVPTPKEPGLGPDRSLPVQRRNVVRRLSSNRRVLVLSSQAASSLSNVVVTVLVAANSDPTTFGRFALAMVGYQLALGSIRSIAAEPLLSLYAHEGPSRRRQIVADIQGTTLFVGAVCSLLLVAAAALVGGGERLALLALALVLPALLLQDTWRYLFVIDRPAATLCIDIVWLAAVLPALMLVPSSAGVAAYILVWGASGSLGGIVGTVIGWGLPSWPHPWRWIVNHREMCWRYFLEFLTAQGTGHAAYAGLAAISSAAAVGAARAAWVIYGVLVVVHLGLYMTLVPEGARVRGQPGVLLRKFRSASIISASVSAVWMLLAALIPDSLGTMLFGSTWEDAQSLLIPVGVMMMANGALSGGILGLQALGDARLSLSARFWSAPPQVVFPLVGAMVGDAMGFVLGMMLSKVLAAAIWWTKFRRALNADEP